MIFTLLFGIKGGKGDGSILNITSGSCSALHQRSMRTTDPDAEAERGFKF